MLSFCHPGLSHGAVSRLARAAVVAGLFMAGSVSTGHAYGDSDQALQALLDKPDIVRGKAEAHSGNLRGAVADFQEAARHGNQMGNILLSLAYFDGFGVPKDRRRAVEILLKIIQKNDVTAGVALKTVRRMSEVMKESPDPRDRQMSELAMLGAITASPYAKKMSEMMSHMMIVPCFGYAC